MIKRIFKTQTRDGVKEVMGVLCEHKDIKYFVYKTERNVYFSVELVTGLGICDRKLRKDCIKDTNDKIDTAYDYITKIRNEYILLGKQVNETEM